LANLDTNDGSSIASDSLRGNLLQNCPSMLGSGALLHKVRSRGSGAASFRNFKMVWTT
jgi:hypothetical protein